MNPTLLYKLIEGKDWDAAITRVEKAPLEANTWVARYEAGDASKLRWRLLPLHACCIFRAPVALLEALLRAFPDGAQMKDDQGMLPVHLACRNGASKGVVMMLLDAFPESVSLKDRKGRTPLMFTESSSSQNREAVIIGIRKFIQDYNNNTQTTPANYNSRSAVAAQSAANEVDYEHRTVLFRLILKKDWENAGLRAKSSPDEASTWIVTKGFKGNLRFLPLHKACVLSPPESVVESLVAAFPEGAKSKDQDGWLPIHCACFYGASQGAIDTLLVAYPKGSQSKDDEGRLPIHYACLKGASTGVVESLLGTFPKGAQSKDDEGRLPIHHACSKGAPEGVITALLNSSPKGAQSKDDQGRLPIHHACRKNCSEKVIKALLKTYPKGAQVKDDQDKLPIHYVCQNGGSEDVINVLLAAYPFSINVKNGFGYTPLAEAKAMDNPKMEKVVATLEKFISNNPHLTSQGEEKAFQAAEDSSKRAMKAERVAAEAHEDQQVLMAKVADLEATVGQLQRQLDFLAQVGSEMKSSLAEGVTARECLETFGEKLMNINKISS
eukprot:CAMPEP_0178964970 /NCGR_PEP_ID=MMETSP0789-20121207/15994_1 /TAXON_ID=3005 /ORGANISM="Rhizosolenia setigera, Strain CCMP 1694" /LENGTH=552 /DNA_ID=CAMNT_0020649847 /DNA_START=169 /DNA_END=1827 /DNA_ORIENTATION=+